MSSKNLGRSASKSYFFNNGVKLNSILQTSTGKRRISQEKVSLAHNSERVFIEMLQLPNI
jgi:hypothetical protein